MLETVGQAGQKKLLASSVLIVGAGGLGSPAALYLAAAGVGTIGLLDGDAVDLGNLQRQIAHGTADVGKRKVVSAREAIQAINPDVAVRIYDQWATAKCLAEIVEGYDFVIDAVDNFATKFLINDACHLQRVPFSHAGVLRFEGQLMTVLPGKTACYRCVFGRPPSAESVPPPSQAGVLGVVPGVLGTLQATEAIKFILGIGDLLTDCLLTYDALAMRFRTVRVKHNGDCPLCVHNPHIKKLADE
jgi:molybdopterin/thiamine biosynthesis adenylyltransferase